MWVRHTQFEISLPNSFYGLIVLVLFKFFDKQNLNKFKLCTWRGSKTRNGYVLLILLSEYCVIFYLNIIFLSTIKSWFICFLKLNFRSKIVYIYHSQNIRIYCMLPSMLLTTIIFRFITKFTKINFRQISFEENIIFIDGP